VGTPFGVEEVEDVFNLEKLGSEVVVDDNEGEDVAAIDKDNKAVQ